MKIVGKITDRKKEPGSASSDAENVSGLIDPASLTPMSSTDRSAKNNSNDTHRIFGKKRGVLLSIAIVIVLAAATVFVLASRKGTSPDSSNKTSGQKASSVDKGTAQILAEPPPEAHVQTPSAAVSTPKTMPPKPTQ